MTPKIDLIWNTSWCSKTISTGTSGYSPILSMCSFSGPARSRMFIDHSSRLQMLHTTTNYRMVYPSYPTFSDENTLYEKLYNLNLQAHFV
jgi:hypothetical protein